MSYVENNQIEIIEKTSLDIFKIRFSKFIEDIYDLEYRLEEII